MAAKPAEGAPTVENEESSGDCSGKKKSKFQAFKKLFVKKKRKESPAPSRESNLKPSQSSSDVSVSGANESAFQPAHESVAKSSMGSKAVSHDSVFISEMESSTKEDTSQENTPGKVKALQLQLQQNIRIGSPPQGIIHKKLEDSGALSEDDGLPRSPPDITSLHEILALSSGKTSCIAQRRSSLSLGGTDSEDEPESCETSSCPISPLNYHSPSSHYFTAPLGSVTCLDNSAAKHKIAVKPKKRRGPAMKVNRIKDGAGITKDSKQNEKEKNENKVVHEHEVHNSHSGESSVEQEAPIEQAKCIEDVVQETETDTTMSLSVREEDLSVEKTHTDETSFCGKQIMALPVETEESDVDFHVGCLIVEDQENGGEEDSAIGKECTETTDISLSALEHEPNEITALLEPSEIEYNAKETHPLEIFEDADTECDISEDLLRIQENTSVLETDEPVLSDKDQDHNEDEKASPNLTNLQRDLPEVTASISDTNVISTPHQHICEAELNNSIIKDEEPVSNASSEGILVCESTSENPSSAETLQQSSTNATTDQITIINTPTMEKIETFDLRISEKPKTISVDDSSTKCAFASINLASGANGNDDNQCRKEPSTEISRTVKPTDADSKLRTSNKPVRFTVAPAWQRSLSIGSSVKDTTYSKNKISSAMKSESFDGTEDPVRDINQEDSMKGEKNNEDMVTTNKEDACVAFGVRLRRTSSSRKYSEEYPEGQSKLYLSSAETSPVSIVPTRNVQTPTKTQQIPLESTKVSKPSHTSEDKPQKKPKPEDPSPQENSEPSWITMAKLKRKGFQEHPLAKEHNATTESDKNEGSGETAAISQQLEVKETEPTSTESPVVEESLPESGKNAQSASSQNPDEPPWFSLAKKKAKAWSKMPQIVQ